MAILNTGNFPYILTQFLGVPGPSKVEYRSNTFVWLLRNFNDGNNYWYCEIFNGSAFEVFDINSIIPKNILDNIKADDKTFLYICNSHEAFLHIVPGLYETLVVKEHIPPKKIIIANEAVDLYIEVKRYADLHNLDYFNVDWISTFEANISLETSHQKLYPIQTLDINRTYNKRFLNFNRRWRLHRPTLVALMQAVGILDKGFVSLGHCDDNQDWDKMYSYVKRYNSVNLKLLSLLEKAEEDVLNLPPLYLDSTDLTVNKPHIEAESSYLYHQSLISVVSETTFYISEWFNPARFLSEKTFKPVGYGHPFILVTTPKSLELFKEMGYKSFHPFIDESYDSEMDDYERMLKIVKEIKRICDMNNDEVKDFIRKVRPIVEFNQEALMAKSRGVGIIKNFCKKML